MVSFMGGGEWWADLWFIERRRMKYVHRKSTQFDPFLSHTYIASLPTKADEMICTATTTAKMVWLEEHSQDC